MGTRADFYAGGTDPGQMVWLGSIANDGYPTGVDIVVLTAPEEEDYIERVAAMLANRDDATVPAQGWPWPWNDSATTDYAYVWTPEGVRASVFGSEWFRPGDAEPTLLGVTSFPDMTAVQNVAFDQRSGLLFIAEADE